MADNPNSPGRDGEEQQPNNGGLDSYQLKRLHHGAGDDVFRRFFGDLTSVEHLKELSTSYLPLQNYYPQTLRYIRDSYFDYVAQNPGADSSKLLFRSEVALAFNDWVIKNNELKKNLSNALVAREAKEKAGELIRIVEFCKNFGNRDYITLSESEEKSLSKLLEKQGTISAIAKFIIDYIDKPLTEKELAGEKDEETEEKDDDKAVAAGAATAADDTGIGAGEGDGDAGGDAGEGGVGAGDTDPDSPTQPAPTPTPQTPSQPLADEPLIAQDFIDPIVRRETARFATITLIQLEKFHELTEGLLQNSPELRAAITGNVQGFFATTLTRDQLKKLEDPLERRKLVETFFRQVLADGTTTTTLHKVFDKAVREQPAIKQHLEEQIAAARKGEKVSELVKDIADNPEFADVIKNIEESNPIFQESSNIVRNEISRELLQQLSDLGLRDEKLLLARENMLNTLNTMIDQQISIKTLESLSPAHFRALFSDDIPYNPRLIEYLQEKTWPMLRSMKGRERGDVIWNAEQLFVLNEAQKYLNENNPDVTPAQAEDVTKELLNSVSAGRQANKAAGVVDSDQPIRTTDGSLTSLWNERFQEYLQNEWNKVIRDQEKLAQFAFYAGYDQPTLEIVVQYQQPPTEFRYFDAYDGYPMFTQADRGINYDYMPDNSLTYSPLAGAADFQQKVQGYNNIKNLAGKLGGGFLNRIRGLAGNKAQDKVAKEIGSAGGKVIGSALGGPVGTAVGSKLGEMVATEKGRKQLALALAALATALVAPLLNLLTKLFRSGGSSLATGAGGLISRGTSALTGGAKVAARPAGATTGLGLGGGEAQAGAAGSGGALAVVGTAVTTTASQAVLATVGLLGATTMFSHLVVSNALLADFPIVDPFATSVPGTQGKISEYVEIEKLVFIDGCPNARCENPDFPVQAEYSITIRPKDDYSIRLTEVTDTISTSHSSQAWEDEGRTAPEIPDKVRTIDDFAELYPDQTINAGEEVSFTYSETLDENYNHAAITNSFEIKFFPGGGSGVHNPNGDNAITGEVIILGDYSKGAGCWPTSGRVSQLPGGGFSHQNADAFDIAENAGTTIWSPFDGEICVGGMDDQIYGLHLQLFADGKTFVMGHLRATNIRARCSSNQRDEVFPGMPVGEMGTTGRSTGPHLHWGLRGSNPRPSTLATLMPNGVAVKEDQYVESCYAHQ